MAILFYLKENEFSRRKNFGLCRITYDGQRTELAIGQKIQPKLWNPSEERAKGKSDAVNKLNAELNAVELRINDTIRYLKDCGEELTIEKIKTGSREKRKNPSCWLMYSKSITVRWLPW